MVILATIFFLSLSAWSIWRKYPVVIGGTLVQAKVTQVNYRLSVRGIAIYQTIVKFTYQGKTKPIALGVFFRKRAMGKQVSVYYKDSKPKFVYKKDLYLEIWAILFATFAIAILFTV